MRTKHIVAAASVAAAVLLAGAGCSSTSDDTAKASTTVASKSSGDAGKSSTTTGGGSSTDDVALPADWPDELALPDDVVVLDATAVTGGHSWVVHARVDGDPKAALDDLESQLTAADWTIVSSDFTESPQGGFGGISGTSRQQTVAISLGPDSTGDTTEVQISLADKTST